MKKSHQQTCSIMDQFIVSCGVVGHLMLLDCQSLEVMQIPIKELDEHPIFLITNSNVEHAIANGEYCMVSDDVNIAKQ